MKTAVFQNLVWAVDTMEPEEFQKNAQFILGAITRETFCTVWPVHFLTFPYADPKGTTTYEEAYTALAEKRLSALRQKSEVPEMKSGEVFINRKGTIRSAVEMLVEFARGKRAQAIVVSTHSRSAVQTLFLGSFAESLLLNSTIPVITVNPQAKIRERIGKVLFPTSFGDEYRPSFEKTVELCSTLGADLCAYYKEPFIPMMEPSFEFFRYLEEESSNRKMRSAWFRECAVKNRVNLEIRMDEKPGNVADEISAFASEHNFDLIAMVSQANAGDWPRLGSTCRKVVRQSPCAVWTMKTLDS